MKIVGIDPGKHGVAVLTDTSNKEIMINEFDFDKNNHLNLKKYQDFLIDVSPNLIVFEKNLGRGGWGATQIYNFGFITGQILTMSRHVAYVMVPPQTWQARVCKGIPKTDTTKKRSLDAYNRLFPSNPLSVLAYKKGKLNENILDAFLISIYGQMEYGSINDFQFNHVWKHPKNDI